MRHPIPVPWRIPTYLIVVSLVPFMATASRLLWIGNADAAPDPAMDRFDGSPLILTIHILFGSVFLLFAATQFSTELRNANRALHRLSGMIAMTAGFVAGVSGVGLVVAYPPSDLATPTMDALRVLFGAGLAGAILIAFIAIRNRNVTKHRAWMIRAFSLAVAGSTQALLIGLWVIFVSPLSPESATTLISIGFFINIVFAEWRIRAFSLPNSIYNAQGKIT